MHKDNFSYLLVALLIAIIAIPIANDLELISLTVSRIVGVSSVFAIGVWSLRPDRWHFRAGMAIVVVGVVLTIWTGMRESGALFILSELSLLAFLLLVCISALQQVAVGNDLSFNRIVGAICIYLLLGLMWAITYSMLNFWQPDSFSGVSELALSTWHPDWLYFSFVTITTLGYGDITPVTQTAKTLSFAEAIMGQFYVAVLVAGLVSAYSSAKRR